MPVIYIVQHIGPAMENWLDQFITHYDAVEDYYSTPVWFLPKVLISSAPGAKSITDDLWSTEDGFFVSTATKFLNTEKNEYTHSPEPAVMLLFMAKDFRCIQWHRHKEINLPKFPKLENSNPDFRPCP